MWQPVELVDFAHRFKLALVIVGMEYIYIYVYIYILTCSFASFFPNVSNNRHLESDQEHRIRTYKNKVRISNIPVVFRCASFA